MNWQALLALLNTPQGLNVIEGIGHAITTFAEHNRTLLGQTGQVDLEKVGGAVQAGAGVASGLGAFQGSAKA